MPWKCPSCTTTDESLRYPSGKIARCIDCTRFDGLLKNAARVRRNGEGFVVDFDRSQFLEWIRSQRRHCIYCGVTDVQLRELDLLTQVGRPLAALGIDRLDNERGYELANIALCCFPCNKAKGNVFTEAEMRASIGPAIAATWRRRRGVSEPDLLPEPGLYRHHKGEVYELLSIAIATETGERQAIYRLEGSEQLYARPLAMFCERLADGIPRFEALARSRL